MINSGESYKGKILLSCVDIAIATQVDEWIEAAVKEFGRLDGAANVAGLSKRTPETTSMNIVGYPSSFLVSYDSGIDPVTGSR
jgi:NAD(P)-dependent dehydrogenase (short-subunit alcohol dehydrogenase family)